MSTSIRTAARVLPFVLLAGCGATFDYAGLRDLQPSGDGFAAHLARDYKDFALFEADRMYDWPDAARFGDKALAAAAGAPPAPERPADWRLPDSARAAIATARARLAAALSGGARERAPRAAASAQTRFDCWVEQQEENWQVDHIARCRDGFHAAMDRVTAALTTPPAAAEDTSAPPLPVVPAAHVPETMSATVAVAPPAPQSFTAFFAFDSDALDAPATEAIAAAARAAASGAKVRVVVHGHADRAGAKPYNMALSRQRALAVSRALAEHGVAPDRITIGAYGETRPRVATPDGIREPRNRRVEVTVGPAPSL